MTGCPLLDSEYAARQNGKRLPCERLQVENVKLRELVEDMDSAAIVAHVVPYYHGWQVEGEWLDDWRDAVMAECDRLDVECKAYVWREVER